MIEENSSGMWDVAVTSLGLRYAWPKCWTERPWYLPIVVLENLFYRFQKSL